MPFETVDLARLQFAMTAMYHFLFVPLTLGLSFLMAVMETVYVISGKTIWRDMTKFWGKLFAINFAMGVATGITMEFQFGTNWSYYAHYVGDIFGAPLAIEGMLAFFLESTFVGLFFFGWDKMSKAGHLVTTWLVSLGASMSGLWILIANGWMQHPVGAKFNPQTMRMELESFSDVIFNPVAQSKFVHAVGAGYVVGAIFVMAISALYLLKGKHQEIARRSILVASAFGLISSAGVAFMGDESGHHVTKYQPLKLAAIEAMWETHEAPAPLALAAWPDMDKRENAFEISVPWVGGLITTRSLSQPVPGIKDLTVQAEERIRKGLGAYDALKRLKANPDDKLAETILMRHEKDLGHALLLKKYIDNPLDADDDLIAKAAYEMVPHVGSLFWGFRVMVGLGFYFILLFASVFYVFAWQKKEHPLLLKVMLLSLPLPWIAAELGWFVAEYGRQPWAIQDILPTHIGASSLAPSAVLTTLIGFIVLYSTLAVVDVVLMARAIKEGPVPAKGGAK